MSVTNDPNYHEGQPVFGPTDAVRPTGETGALDIRPCPEGHDVHVSSREFQGEKIYRVFCPAGIVYQCWRGAEFHFADKAIEHWNATMVALAVVEESAARPLPDFPAGAPGLPADLEYVEQMMFNSRSDNCEPELLYKYWPEIIKEVRWHRDRLTRTNAPARPAAAGLTEISEDDRYAAYMAGLKRANEETDGKGIYVFYRALFDAGWSAAESLLSSRATGAEVEIAIEDPTALEMMDLVRECMPRAEIGERAELKMSCIRTGIRKGIDFARRHATMRTGGGQ